jgi:eukaryotic-like serine/threonine-protein kinase
MADDLPHLAAALADRYRIERELGAGGMATVYLAEDLKHQRRVAIKVLRPELAAAIGAERFLREITTTANLRHPHILPLYDSGRAVGPAGRRADSAAESTANGQRPTPDHLFYVMPYVEGESLRDRLNREKQLPLDDAIQIAREVADALSYAHSRGVIHRDIKPENILLESGHAVVADFGIARAIDAAGGERLTETGLTIGTPAYMSPEQAAGEQDLDGRSDLYALGCVLYEMLAGQPPFTGATAGSLVHQHLTAEPPPVTQLRPAVPAEIAGILQRALAKAPADRFNPVAQFGEALRRSAGHMTLAEAAPAPGRPARDGTRVLALVAVLVLLGGAGGFLLWRNRGHAAAPPARSVAVLPFVDLTGGANEYLGDGMAETLINALSKVPGLEVAARTSAFSFKGKSEDVRAIGRALGVGAVLEGSVQRSGDRLRVTAQLINAADGFHLWSDNFDRSAGDIFAVQDEVARAVVTALQVRLVTDTGRALTAQGTTNARAYDAYLLGRFYWNKRTAPDLVQAAGYFEQAIALDSGYARAWSGLADSYVLFIPAEYGVPDINPDSILALAESAARRSVALDTLLGEAYASLGEILEYRIKWVEAREAFERAVQLSPEYPTGHQWYSYDLMAWNRWDDATREMERAKELDPLSMIIAVSLAATYDGAERWQDASAMYEQARALAPAHPLVVASVFWHDLLRGDVEASATHYPSFLRTLGPDTAGAGAVARQLRDPAQREAALRHLALVADPITGMVISRVLDGDKATIAYMNGVPKPRRVTMNTAIIACFLGPRLRANSQMRDVLEGFGFPKQP